LEIQLKTIESRRKEARSNSRTGTIVDLPNPLRPRRDLN
jgi:hypothetical protein